MPSAASSNFKIRVNTGGCFSPQICHCKMYNYSILNKQVLLHMNIVSVCVIATACKYRDYTGQAKCSERINLEGARAPLDLLKLQDLLLCSGCMKYRKNFGKVCFIIPAKHVLRHCAISFLSLCRSRKGIVVCFGVRGKVSSSQSSYRALTNTKQCHVNQIF